MKGVALLFPGQGAKRVHEALRFAVRWEAGRALCERACRAADVGLERVIARPSLLDRTDVLQPVLTAISLAIAGRLDESGCSPEVVLGHSAGEIAAWASAGGLSAEQAISLAARRGALMAREAALHPGGMVALATSDAAVIEEALSAGRKAGALCIAAHNAPDETVLSGDEPAVRAVLAFAPGLATRLPTSGAWHSPAMEGAVAEWEQALSEVPSRPLRCDLVANRTGEIAGDVREALAAQLTSPVAWTRALATIRGRSRVVVTVGPGAVVRALWHRCFGRGAKAGEVGDSRASVGDSGAPSSDSGSSGGEPRLFATEDERSLGETMAFLRGLE